MRLPWKLRIVQVEAALLAQLKSKAALAGTTLRIYVLEVLRGHIKKAQR